MYIFISAVAWWLFTKNKAGVHVALTSLLLIVVLRTADLWMALQQRKLVVYNIPKYSAMDVINGNRFFFKGDSTVARNDLLQNLYVQPCRLLHRVTNPYNTGNLLVWNNFFRLGHSSFFVINRSFALKRTATRIAVDVLIISQNPSVQITELTDVFTCRQVVFDSSNPARKIDQWQRECHELGIPCFSVATRGAFVLNLY